MYTYGNELLNILYTNTYFPTCRQQFLPLNATSFLTNPKAAEKHVFKVRLYKISNQILLEDKF